MLPVPPSQIDYCESETDPVSKETSDRTGNKTYESKADVASSNSNILGLRMRARAMAIRCF